MTELKIGYTHISERHTQRITLEDRMLCGASWAPNTGFSWNPEPYLDLPNGRTSLMNVCPACLERYENDPTTRLLRAMGGHL